MVVVYAAVLINRVIRIMISIDIRAIYIAVFVAVEGVVSREIDLGKRRRMEKKKAAEHFLKILREFSNATSVLLSLILMIRNPGCIKTSGLRQFRVYSIPSEATQPVPISGKSVFADMEELGVKPDEFIAMRAVALIKGVERVSGGRKNNQV
uniref:Uncharacterized protein n=1 Tax=Chenopodium quinoa TaxID=63459 RepID=A0A803N9D0_CHEQI